ncbi:hypothetical protein [Hyphomicrobium sp.]|jgi:hypothetical protein|uniref:hypothetical protein n=1 Tax=Hyphomicrobium sp. TaxID=82 RepID=UPI0035643C23
MKRLLIISALALGTVFGAAGAASAAPASTAVGGLSNGHSGIELADYKRNRHMRHGRDYRRGNWRHNRGYRGGDRYRGWHRYHSRPHGWRARGCVVVGPVWVCP